MHCIRPATQALSVFLLAGLAACATAPVPSDLEAQNSAIQEALELALKPASDEEKAQADRSEPLKRANFWATEYRKDPSDMEVTIAFMRALRGIGSTTRVQEVGIQSLALAPDNHEIYLELGRAYLSENNIQAANRAFKNAVERAPASDAASLAALGLSYDRLGYHEEAQDAYQRALERSPQRLSTLNNYSLSLAITGHLDTAETVLRYAASLSDADMRVRQNLALILGLQGKFEEMASIDPDAPRRTITANRQILETMIRPDIASAEGGRFISPESLSGPDKITRSMPELRQARIEEEALSDPAGLKTEPQPWSAPSEQPFRLKPRLKSKQGG